MTSAVIFVGVIAGFIVGYVGATLFWSKKLNGGNR